MVWLSARGAERITAPDAPVTVLDPKARVLNWPNRIRDDDWKGWVGERALLVPTLVDEHYSKILEMHDAGENKNQNTLLVAPFGKGTVIYTTLAFQEQIPAGVSGALRLFVNLISAGLAAEPKR